MKQIILGLLILCSAKAAAGQAVPYMGEVLTVQVQKVDSNYVAVTQNEKPQRMFLIVCDHSVWSGNYADLLLPNREGQIVTDNYRGNNVQVSNAVVYSSPYIQLNDKAVSAICSSNSGIFTLQINGKKSEPVAELL